MISLLVEFAEIFLGIKGGFRRVAVGWRKKRKKSGAAAD